MSASQNLKIKKNIEVVAMAMRCATDGKYLLARRGPGSSGEGFWEFPGGKIETGETQEQALRREICEELSFDLNADELQFIGEHLHSYPQQQIRIFLWTLDVLVKPSFVLVDHDEVRWLSVEEIKKINLSDGDKHFISLLKMNF